MCLAFIAMGAFQSSRDREQGHFHVEVMRGGELSRLRRDAVPARITAQPKAIAEALYVGKVNLAPGVILWLCVPHTSIPTLEALSWFREILYGQTKPLRNGSCFLGNTAGHQHAR